MNLAAAFFVRLINGTSEPELTIAAGQIERWRIEISHGTLAMLQAHGNQVYVVTPTM